MKFEDIDILKISFKLYNWVILEFDFNLGILDNELWFLSSDLSSFNNYIMFFSNIVFFYIYSVFGNFERF